MKIDIKYSGKILNLPASVADFAPDASREELVVIIGLFSSIEYLGAFDKYIETFSEKIGIGIERIKKAFNFWSEKGVIEVDGDFDDIQISSASSSVPTYTGAQISKFMEHNEDIRSLFMSCQAVLGKEFNPSDYNNIVFLKEHYSFNDEYILLLLAHCKEIEKTNWNYIKTTAKRLYESGIDTYKELEKYFIDRHNKQTLEFKIRELFGIGKREFAKTESENFNKWINADLDIELIKVAYDITVTKTGKASVKYCSKIIDNWLSSGIKTAEDALRTDEEYRFSLSSFDTNDAFEAALRRSYGKKGEK